MTAAQRSVYLVRLYNESACEGPIGNETSGWNELGVSAGWGEDMYRRLSLALGLVTLFCSSAFSQETRSTISGRVLDPQGAAVVGAAVVVRNADTGVALTFRTNEKIGRAHV